MGKGIQGLRLGNTLRLAGRSGGAVDLFLYVPGPSIFDVAAFSRNNMADYTDSNSATQSAAVNEPRDAHYVGATRTLLIS